MAALRYSYLRTICAGDHRLNAKPIDSKLGRGRPLFGDKVETLEMKLSNAKTLDTFIPLEIAVNSPEMI